MTRPRDALGVRTMLTASLLSGALYAQAQSLTAQSPTPTFTKDIAPIVFKNCVQCHRTNGIAPFSLMTYAEVRRHARLIAEVTKRRVMPPWKPEPGFGEFEGERRLTDEEIARIGRWVEQGAPEGDPKALPNQPQYGDGGLLGRPDLIVKMPVAYRLRAGGPDMFRTFVVPIPSSIRRHVRAWQFDPGNPTVVHHATMLLDSSRTARQRDQEDPEPGYEGLIPFSAQNPDGYFLGWTPGQTPQKSPRGMSWTIEKDTDLLMELHLRPNGKEEMVQAALGLYFDEGPPTRTPFMIRLNRQDIDIPADEKHYTLTDSYTLPVDLEAYAVQPHARNLAQTIKGFATLPDGTRKWLISINSWDFNWQDAYRFRTPMFLPAGTRMTMEYTYDNSAENPRNPNNPPRRVSYGQLTSNEMGDLWVQVVPRRASDLSTLARDFQAKLLPQNISGYEMMVKTDPDNSGLRDDLALLYVQSGDLTRASAQFAASARIRPGSAAAHYNFGMSLLAIRDLKTAGDEFQHALRIQPGYANAHYGLGLVLDVQGQAQEAVNHYQEALRLATAAHDDSMVKAVRERLSLHKPQ